MSARWLGPTFLLAIVVACGGGADETPGDPTASTDAADTSFVDDGADANAVETDTQLLVSSLVASIESQAFGDGVKAVFLPRACVTATNDATSSTVTFEFDGCLGPNGLRAVSGTVRAKYVVKTGSVELEVTGSGLAVNDASGVGFTASAKIASNGSKRTMDWKASISGSTAGKRAFTRSDDFTVGWTLGDACYTLDGTSEGQVKARGIKVDVTSYQRCRRGCPEAGGRIEITNVAKSKSVAISYDGTNRATYTNANGKDTTFLLLCVP